MADQSNSNPPKNKHTDDIVAMVTDALKRTAATFLGLALARESRPYTVCEVD
jgi:hypothetical protein